MNIQTQTLILTLEDFEKTQRQKMASESGEARAWREGSAETLRLVRCAMVPALENSMRDVVQETEELTATPEELRQHEARIADMLRNGPPEPGDEWKQC